MIIAGMIKSSLIDYPGLVSCILFVPGCNYNCFYCHNRSLIDGSHVVIDPRLVTDFLQKRAGLLDGVVITGGEPTLQHDLTGYLNMIKGLGYQIKLDTNGSSPAIVKQILDADLCDYFAVDYKAPLDRYKEICGNEADGMAVLETINLLLSNQARFEVRTTVIPQLDENDLLRMANELPVVPKYVLNRYKAPLNYLPIDTKRISKKPYTQAEIEQFVKALSSVQPNTVT
jgi:pyruvate formate lyase activating enzyme